MHTIALIGGMASLARTWSALAGRVGVWRERARQRRALAHLDERLLRDIGLSPADVHDELHKAPWQM